MKKIEKENCKPVNHFQKAIEHEKMEPKPFHMPSDTSGLIQMLHNNLCRIEVQSSTLLGTINGNHEAKDDKSSWGSSINEKLTELVNLTASISNTLENTLISVESVEKSDSDY